MSNQICPCGEPLRTGKDCCLYEGSSEHLRNEVERLQLENWQLKGARNQLLEELARMFETYMPDDRSSIMLRSVAGIIRKQKRTAVTAGKREI